MMNEWVSYSRHLNTDSCMSESTSDLIYVLVGFNLDFAFMLQSGAIAKLPRLAHIRGILVSFCA